MSRLVIARDSLFNPNYCGWRRTTTSVRGGAMPIDHLKRSPTDVIMDVLANGRVQSPFPHQSLAEQILACFSALRIGIITEADRELRRAKVEGAHKPRGPIENLRYVIETWDASGNNLLEILGRDALVTPATAAYQAYVDHYPERLIMIRQGGQVIRRSDRRC
jgi:hypothetical protein